MVYLEYRKSDGYVVKIHAQEPTVVDEGNAIFQSEQFNVNDEFTYAIYLHLDENGNPNGLYAAVKQAPVASYLLEQLNDKEQKITLVENDILNAMEALTELYESLLVKGVI